jgi:hypothetical protein
VTVTGTLSPGRARASGSLRDSRVGPGRAMRASQAARRLSHVAIRGTRRVTPGPVRHGHRRAVTVLLVRLTSNLTPSRPRRWTAARGGGPARRGPEPDSEAQPTVTVTVTDSDHAYRAAGPAGDWPGRWRAGGGRARAVTAQRLAEVEHGRRGVTPAPGERRDGSGWPAPARLGPKLTRPGSGTQAQAGNYHDDVSGARSGLAAWHDAGGPPAGALRRQSLRRRGRRSGPACRSGA